MGVPASIIITQFLQIWNILICHPNIILKFFYIVLYQNIFCLCFSFKFFCNSCYDLLKTLDDFIFDTILFSSNYEHFLFAFAISKLVLSKFSQRLSARTLFFFISLLLITPKLPSKEQKPFQPLLNTSSSKKYRHSCHPLFSSRMKQTTSLLPS